MISKIAIVLKFYYLFFIRQVLGLSIMKNNFIKVYLSVIAIVLYCVIFVSFYRFISLDELKFEHIEFILNSYTINIILITYLLFIIIKFFFISNTEVEEKLKIFPLSNKMIRLSSLLLESIIYFALVMCISTVAFVPILLVYKLKILTLVMNNVIFTSISVYLILHLLYNLLLKPFSSDARRRMFPLLFVFFSILVMIILVNYSNDLIMKLAIDFLESSNEHFSILFWQNLTDMSNLFISLLLFIISSVLLTFLVIVTTSNNSLVNYKYLNIKMVKHNYISCLVKSNVRKVSNNINVAIYYLLFITFIMVDYNTTALPPLISIASLYVFSNTFSIRKYQYSISYSIVKEYFNLLSSQTIYGIIVLAPTLIYVQNFVIAFKLIVVYMMSMIVMLLLGILFPSKEENPLTPLLSFAVFFVLIMFSILFVSILQLTRIQLYIVVALTLFFVIVISCYGLDKIIKGEKK